MKAGSFKIIFVLALLSLNSSHTLAAKPKILHVAVVLRITDKFNKSVDSLMGGIQTAKDVFEAQNPGTKIELQSYPHSDELSTVVEATKQVVDNKIPAVIGGELSEESIVIGDQLGPQKVVFITPTSSNPKVTENKPFSFRACFSDALVAQKLAEFVVTKLRPGAVGVIHNISSPYTDFLSKKFIETYKENMATTVEKNRAPLYEEQILRDTVDFEKQIENFIKNKVTHVAMLTHESDFMKFAFQAANKGFFPVYIGSDGWGSNENVSRRFVTDSPHAGKFRAFRNTYWKMDSKSQISSSFQNTFKKKFGSEPTEWAAISFDSAWVLFNAMKNARNPNDGDSIRKELLKTKNLALVTTSSFQFGSDNSPRKDLFIYRIDKDGVSYEATLK